MKETLIIKKYYDNIYLNITNFLNGFACQINVNIISPIIILISLKSLLLVNNLPADFLSNLLVLIILAAFVFSISQQRNSEYVC